MKAAMQDRRTQRTREAVLDAFRSLIGERGYRDMTIGDIVARANIGRSTLYDNFASKEDILRHSIAAPFGTLAGIADRRSDVAAVSRLIEHFRQNNRLARALFGGSTRSVLVRTLAALIEEPLSPRWSGGAKPGLPLPLAALQIAEAQIGLIDHWLIGGLPCRGEEIAAALIATTEALIGAQTGQAR